MEIMKAHHQWASRPSDERFTSLTDLHAHCALMQEKSKAKVLSSRTISAAPVENDPHGLMIVGPNGGPVDVTHWAFNQIAKLSDSPAGLLRDLPSDLAADVINDGLHRRRGVEDIGVLLDLRDPAALSLRAATGPNYGRIWNATITAGLLKRFGDGLTGDFRIPGEFGKPVPITKANTTLYAGDRDFFVFLADEEHRIEVPNRRNGQPGSLARGVMFWNSEVGLTLFGMAGFLFDHACSNRIIWGAQDYQELRIRHTAGAPDRWLEEALPVIESYANHSTDSIETALRKAREARIEDVDKFLTTRARFSRSMVSAVKAAHMADEQRPIETIWDAATAITAYARGIEYQNERVALEREAGKLLDLAA